MFLNYLKVGIRNILKYKVFSFINIFGLAAAMSVSMLIILMLADQKSYDQFNTNKENIYRVLCDGPDFRHPYATSPFPLSDVLKSDYPIIETATHLIMGVGGDAKYNQKSAEMRGYFADNSFFKVFSFELESGDPNNALASPNSMVITSALAKRLFNGENAVGKIVEFTDRGLNIMGGANSSTSTAWGNYIITGVIADKEYKSHLKFDVLVSTSSMPALIQEKKIGDRGNNWTDYFNCFTYVMLTPGKKMQDLNGSLNELVSRKYADLKDFKGFRMMGQKLTQISPGMLLGNEQTIALPRVAYYFLSLLAMVIMISACLNYINLSIARALNRAKEIGVRKVTGANRKDLIAQFLGESILTALFALIMAIVLLLFLKPAFKGLWVNQYLHFDLKGSLPVYLIFTVLALLIGVIAGIYPAFYLSKFDPIAALKNKEGMRPGKLGMRKILSVTQFVISLFFIITSILIYNQFRHFIEFRYEFNSKDIVNIDLQNNDYRLVSKELGAVPGVSGVSACEYIPATARNEGASLRKDDGKAHIGDEGYIKFISLKADEYFLDNLELRLVAGNNLPPAGKSADRYIVVNEAAVKEFGYLHPAGIIGQPFRTPWSDSSLIVIGVVEDFHMRMLLGNDKIEPLMLQNHPANFQYVNVKIASRDLRSTIAALENKWKAIDPVHPMKYEFFNEELAASAQGIFDVVSILGFIAFLAVLIACLGMLGMATYTTERRQKEVSIRKVLGAKNFSNALLLSKEFISVLVIATLIAAPASYILNNLWIRNFPNRVEFGFGTVFTGTLIVLGLGLITIGSQTIRAARRNPIHSLRTD